MVSHLVMSPVQHDFAEQMGSGVSLLVRAVLAWLIRTSHSAIAKSSIRLCDWPGFRGLRRGSFESGFRDYMYAFDKTPTVVFVFDA